MKHPVSAILGLPVSRTRACRTSFLVLLMALITAPVCGQGVQKKIWPTPTPTVDRIRVQQDEVRTIYEGYAKLFVLGHLLTFSTHGQIILPKSMNLDMFAEQPLLADTGDVFVYRAGKRGDVMWPLLVPTPERPTTTPQPTVTPTPLPRDYSLEPTPTVTPTPTYTPTEVEPPMMSLQAITRSQNGSWVMIDESVYGIGDVVNDATVTAIGRKFATIKYFGKTFYVTREGAVRPQDYVESDLIVE